MTAEGLGQSIGPALGGYVVETAGPLQVFRISMGLYAIAVIVGVVLWMMLSRQTRPGERAPLREESVETTR
jgi:hypothetical protein